MDSINNEEKVDVTPQTEETTAKVKKPRAPRKKKTTAQEADAPVASENEEKQTKKRTPRKKPAAKAPTNPKASASPEVPETPEKPAIPEKPEKPVVPATPTLLIRDIVELVQAPQRQLLLNDQQIQQLTLEEAEKRFRWIEGTLALVLNYDIVLSDTNIWLELLVGHTSSHSDPRVNARLQFERQLEFISRLTKYRGRRFMMMSETYEEIDRFASSQEPVNYRDADWTDEDLCRNVAARLAKRLILSQQRENRLRIEGIGAESHHSAFADPAIIRKTVELFAEGKKVLLLTNDASVAIRSMGMCDDLQRHNGIDDETWDREYAPLRPMVMTMDDLKVLDNYTRQYHFMQMAAGKQWMEDVPQQMEKHSVEKLELWMEGFRPGDRQNERRDGREERREKQKQQEQQKKQQAEQKKQQEQQKQQQKAEQQKKEQPKQQQKQQKQQKAKPVEPEQSAEPQVQPEQSVTEPVQVEQPTQEPQVPQSEQPAQEEQPAQPQKPKSRRRPSRRKQ